MKGWVWGFVLLSMLAVGPAGRAEEAAEVPARPELWFPVGEAMVYRLYWGVIPVGEALVSSRWIVREGRPLLVIRFTTKSNKVLRTIYPVDDVMESIIDPVTFLPVQFIKNLREGRYRAHEITRFDHAQCKAYMTSLTNGKEKTYDIESDTRDLISFMYYMRRQQMSPGEERKERVVADEDIYEVLVRPLKYETVKTVNGDKIESLKIEPKAKFDGLFVRKGEAWMWVSNDDDRLITKIVAEVPVANVKIVLDRHFVEEAEPAEDDVMLFPMPPWLKTDESGIMDPDPDMAVPADAAVTEPVGAETFDGA